MTDSITFPSASNMSKLSACPTTKLPQATDWIFQDFFNTMLNGDDLLAPSIQIAELFPQEKLTDATFNLLQSTFSDDCYEAWHDNNQSCTTMTDDHISLPDLEDTAKNSSSSIMNSSDDDDDDDDDEDQDLDMLEDHIHGATFQSDLLQSSNVAPVLIESTISSCTTMSSVSFRQSMDTANISVNQTLTKRKSTSSFSSLKSFMSVFHLPKKSKLDHDYPSMSVPPVPAPAPAPAMAMMVLGGQQKKSSVSSSFSKRFLNYFKRRC